MKVFHKSFLSNRLMLIAAIIAATCGVHATGFTQTVGYDPAGGFRPAQQDFTKIFLQLAGSLEHDGGSVPYLRHMKAEHERIAARYEHLREKAAPQLCPEYMTDDYLDRLEANWNGLAGKLDLEGLARRSGRNLRLALEGSDGSGTFFVDVLNTHQRRVYLGMTPGSPSVDFDDLLAVLRQEVHEPDPVRFMVSRETGLSESERHALSGFLRKERFAKSDLQALEEFYEASHVKLTDSGKEEISRRLWRGMREGNEPINSSSHDEGLRHAQAFLREFESLFARLDAALPADDAEKLKNAITSVFLDLGRMAHSELEAGILEWALDQEESAAAALAGGR